MDCFPSLERDTMCVKCKPRLEMILSNLRNQNDGATIHEVGNMRHLAGSLMQLTERGLGDGFVCEETKKLEVRSVEFFKRKYGKRE